MFFKTPKKYIGSDVEGITGVLNIGSIILPIIFIIALVNHLISGNQIMAIVVGIGLILSLLIRRILLQGYLRQAVMASVILITILLTIICSFGYGVHDISIIGFPIIIGFSSILLEEKQLIVSSILTVVGLIWLVIGEKYALINPGEIPPGNLADFVIASSIIVLGGVIAFSLTTSMKDSLGGVNLQIIASKKEAEKLIGEVQQKEEIMIEVHQAVINSLSQLELIVDDQSEGKYELAETYESLERKILVIKCAHEILLKNRSPLEIDLIQFTKVLLEKINANGQRYQLDVSIEDRSYQTRVDHAIYFGICTIELIQKLKEIDSSEIKITLTVKDTVQLKIAGRKELDLIKGDMIIDLLVQQLKSDLLIRGNELYLTLHPITA